MGRPLPPPRLLLVEVCTVSNVERLVTLFYVRVDGAGGLEDNEDVVGATMGGGAGEDGLIGPLRMVLEALDEAGLFCES